MMPARCSKPTEKWIRERPETRERRTMRESNPKVTPILAASIVSRPRVVAGNIKRKGPAQTPGRSLVWSTLRTVQAAPRFLVDGAFGDLGQGRIGLLFFSEGLVQKPEPLRSIRARWPRS